MRNARIAFYKAKHGQVDDKFIDFFSGRKGYSHCEIVINDTTMIGAHYLAGGVKKFYYNNIYDSEYWDIFEIPDVSHAKVSAYAHKQLGLGYDTAGVVLYFIGLTMGDSEDKVWCSELCARALNNNMDKRYIYPLTMPNDLYLDIISLGAQQVGKVVNATSKQSYKPEVDRFGRVGYADK